MIGPILQQPVPHLEMSDDVITITTTAQRELSNTKNIELVIRTSIPMDAHKNLTTRVNLTNYMGTGANQEIDVTIISGTREGEHLVTVNNVAEEDEFSMNLSIVNIESGYTALFQPVTVTVPAIIDATVTPNIRRDPGNSNRLLYTFDVVWDQAQAEATQIGIDVDNHNGSGGETTINVPIPISVLSNTFNTSSTGISQSEYTANVSLHEFKRNWRIGISPASFTITVPGINLTVTVTAERLSATSTRYTTIFTLVLAATEFVQGSVTLQNTNGVGGNRNVTGNINVGEFSDTVIETLPVQGTTGSSNLPYTVTVIENPVVPPTTGYTINIVSPSVNVPAFS